MRNHTITTYSLDELNPEARTAALEANRHTNVEETAVWSAGIVSDWEERLSSYGFNDAEIYFEGFGGQGDGACFDADIDMETLMNRLGYTTAQSQGILDAHADGLLFEIKENPTRYQHEYARYFEINTDDIEDQSILNFAPIVEQKAEALRLQLCKDIYKELSEQYFYLITDDAVADTLTVNDYEFNKDGSTFTS